MNAWRRWLPRPALTLVLAIIWVGLNRSFSLGQVLLGLTLGMLVAQLATRAAPVSAAARAEHRNLPHAGRLLLFIGLVGYDILVANLRVAALILGPSSRIRSGFAEVPLDLKRDIAIHVLASVVTLTPGTVSLRINADRSSLQVHYLSSDDPEAVVHDIKSRYESRIKGIFEC